MSPVRPKATASPDETQLSFELRLAVVTVAGAVSPDPLPDPLPLRGREERMETEAIAKEAIATAVVRVLAVSELVRAARATMEARFSDVRVEGEISGLKRSGPGHIYFCLKDAE